MDTANRALGHIMQLIRTGRHTAALPLAQQLVHEHPDNAEAWFILAGLHAGSGNIEAVIDCCRQAVRLDPRHAGAFYNLATALHHTGHPDESAAAYARCLELDPARTAALTGIGKVRQSQGRYSEARDRFLDAHRREPRVAQHLLNAGMACSAGGDQQRACDFYHRALQIDAGQAEPWYLTGIALQKAGDVSGAIAAYRQAVQRKPGYLEALNNLGHLLGESGRLQEAVRIFRELTNAYPGNAGAWSNLGVVCESMGELDEAEAAYRRAIDIDPARTDTLCHLGHLLGSDGRTAQAIECFDRALAVDPDLPTPLAGKASALEKAGDIEAAAGVIQPLIVAGSRTGDADADAVLVYCRIALRRNEIAPAIRRASGLLERDDLPVKAVSELHRILGELYERRQDYATAFAHFDRANRHAPCNYVESDHVAFVERIIRHTGADLLARLPRARHDFRRIAFIVGMPRSGTSLVEQILASHPDVFGGGELPFLGAIATAAQLLPDRPGRFPEAMADMHQADVDGLACNYIEAVAGIAPADRWVTDKMPHNFTYLGLIALLFPQARIIHVRRDPLDNCLSLFFKAFNPLHSYTTDLRLLGGYYRQYERLMRHWRDVLPVPVIEVQYENIVADLAGETTRLLEACDLPWSDACLEFHSSGRFVKTPSYDQVRRPIYTSSVGRWRHYRRQLAPLREALAGEA